MRSAFSKIYLRYSLANDGRSRFVGNQNWTFWLVGNEFVDSLLDEWPVETRIVMHYKKATRQQPRIEVLKRC